ncbi:MAG: hypothetical protein ACRCZI_07775, partial [Cetobacterium sp.]
LMIQDFKRLSWPVLEWPLEESIASMSIGLDSEYTPAEVLCFGVANSHAASSLPLDDEQALEGAVTLTGQNIFTDVDSLVRAGWGTREEWLRGIDIVDCLLLARMSDENRGKGAYDLETLLQSAYNVKGWKEKTDSISESDPTLWGEELRNERVRLDAWAGVKVAEHFSTLAKGPKQFTHQIAACLHRIRHTGVLLDRGGLVRLHAELQTERERAKDLLCKEAFAAGMTEFEPTNDGHIRELMYKRLDLDVIEKTKTGKASVAKTTLKIHKSHSAIQHLSAFNEADKLCGLIDGEKGILPNLSPGLVHAGGVELVHLPVNINPLTTRTARRSSSRPNMQNWKPEMRRLVRSRWDGGKI